MTVVTKDQAEAALAALSSYKNPQYEDDNGGITPLQDVDTYIKQLEATIANLHLDIQMYKDKLRFISCRAGLLESTIRRYRADIHNARKEIARHYHGGADSILACALLNERIPHND